MGRKTVHIAAFIILFGLLAGALSVQPVPLRAQQIEKSITIAFTHDLHDQYFSLPLEVDNRIVTVGGWARLATAIAAERQRDPNLVLVDAGDYSMGTLFQMLFAEESPGLRLLGKMGYDAVTLGNHEFDFLPEGLAKHLSRAVASGDRLPAVVASNTVFPEGELSENLTLLKEAFSEYPVLDYYVLEKGSVRIGLFGLMGKEADSNAPLAGVQFADQIETAREMVQILHNEEQVDLVVCLSHSGTDPDPKRSEDEILAAQVEGIDVIISGHSHTLLPEPLVVNNTLIVSAGQYGGRLGVLSLQYGESGWQIGDYRLIPLGANVPEHEEIAEKVEEFGALLESRYLSSLGFGLDDILAYTSFSFTPFDQVGAEHREEPLGNLIADAYRYAVAAAEGENYEEIAVAVVPNGIIRGSFVQGAITTYDAFIVSSLGIGPDGQSGFPLLSVYLTGDELLKVCEVDASITPLMSSAQLYMAGMTYTFNPYRMPLNKVTDAALIDSTGARVEIEKSKLYRVVVGLYSAQMLSVVGEKSFGLLPIEPKDRDGNLIEDFLAHIIYLERNDELLEMKEWMALAEYLQSFPMKNGIATVPDHYRTVEGRKNVIADRNLSAILGKPNHLAIKAYLLVAGLTLLFILGIILMMRFRRRKKLGVQ
jgi:5'-nucleotidase / UDP-sugar diphosphatase